MHAPHFLTDAPPTSLLLPRLRFRRCMSAPSPGRHRSRSSSRANPPLRSRPLHAALTSSPPRRAEPSAAHRPQRPRPMSRRRYGEVPRWPRRTQGHRAERSARSPAWQKIATAPGPTPRRQRALGRPPLRHTPRNTRPRAACGALMRPIRDVTPF